MAAIGNGLRKKIAVSHGDGLTYALSRTRYKNPLTLNIVHAIKKQVTALGSNLSGSS